MKTTLVAVSGMSPAILTETLWALGEKTPAVVPDDVVVITTTKGEEDISRDLLAKRGDWGGRSVWETLRADLFKKTGLPARSKALQLSVRVIELPDERSGVKGKAADLRSGAENAAAADFIVETLSPFVEAADHRVIASIAGGRKTMGALLYAAMSLIGRETDRVTHVLVSEPFETVRGFFYPDQPVQALEAKPFGKPPEAVVAEEARIDLADIPFVPLRNGFAEMNEARRSFGGLVDRYSLELRRVSGLPPKVRLDLGKGHLFADEKHIALSGRTLLVAYFLLERSRQALPHFGNAAAAEGAFAEFFRRNLVSLQNHPKLYRYFEAKSVTSDDIVKALSDFRRKLAAAGLAHCVPYLCPERSRVGFDIDIDFSANHR